MIKIIKGSDKDILVRVTSEVSKDPYDFTGVDEIRACFLRAGGGSVYRYLLARTGDTTAGSDIISSMSSTASIAEGDPISGPGIPTGSTVLKTPTSTVSPTPAGSIRISQNATATAAAVALSIGWVSVMNAVLGKIKVSLDEAGTEALESGEGQGFEVRIVKDGRTSYVQFPESLNIIERLC